MDATVQTAVVGGGFGAFTLIASELFRRWKGRNDKRVAAAQADEAEASAAKTTGDALILMFKEIAARQDDDIRDLRERVRMVENELMTTRRENDTLRGENTALKAENSTLRAQVDQQRGEIANLNTVIESQKRAAAQ